MPKAEEAKDPGRRGSIASHKSAKSAKSLGVESKDPTHLSISTATDMLSVNHSFNELVAFNEEGHPYIDINKLIYRSSKKYHEHYSKEKLSNYFPDFGFIVFNFLSLGCSTYFILLGATTLTWKASKVVNRLADWLPFSTGMFQIPTCTDPSVTNSDNFFYLPCHIFTNNTEGRFGQDRNSGYNFSTTNSFPILRTKLTEIHYFGLTLICLELVNIVNVFIGINACLQGYKLILIQHIVFDGLLVLGEFIIAAIATFTASCQPKDIEVIKVLLYHYVRHYGVVGKDPELETEKEKLLNAQIDALQISLGCCGVDGWQDYLPADFPESDFAQSRSQLDETDMVIPFSCCRPWWIRNIYCAHGAHLWAHPMASAAAAERFHERIQQEGCLYKLVQMCENIKMLMGQYGFVATLIHLGFVLIEAISALVLIKNINMLIREKKRQLKKKEMHGDDWDVGSDVDVMALSAATSTATATRTQRPSLSTQSQSSKSHKVPTDPNNPWSAIPPPTEYEILTIKQRSNFNKFMALVRGSFVGKWIKEAQEQVTEGHEDTQETKPQTAEERKAREKELLHSKRVQRGEEDEEDEYAMRLRLKKHLDRHGVDTKESEDAMRKRGDAASQASKTKRGRGVQSHHVKVLQKPEPKTTRAPMTDASKHNLHKRKSHKDHAEEGKEQEHTEPPTTPPPLEPPVEFHVASNTALKLDDVASKYDPKAKKTAKKLKFWQPARSRFEAGKKKSKKKLDDEGETTTEEPPEEKKKHKKKGRKGKKGESSTERGGTEEEKTEEEPLPPEPKQTKVLWKKSKKPRHKTETEEDTMEEKREGEREQGESSKGKGKKKLKKLKTKRAKSDQVPLFEFQEPPEDAVTETETELDSNEEGIDEEERMRRHRKKNRKGRHKRVARSRKKRQKGFKERAPWYAWF